MRKGQYLRQKIILCPRTERILNCKRGDIMDEKINLKLHVTGAIEFVEIQKVVLKMAELGYSCMLADNGNLVFEK